MLPVASGVVTEAGVDRKFNVRIPLRDGLTLSADLTSYCQDLWIKIV
jgi:hypothetical protein